MLAGLIGVLGMDGLGVYIWAAWGVAGCIVVGITTASVYQLHKSTERLDNAKP